jgi:hypothetical protein
MSGPTRTLSYRVKKMLASTVQFSTYDQTPPPRPRRTHPPRRTDGGTRNRTAPTRCDHPDSPGDGPLPQDPTACLRTGSPHPPRSTRHRSDAVLGAAAAAGRTGQRSTLELHPGHGAGIRRPDDRHGPGVALDHQTSLAASAP